MVGPPSDEKSDGIFILYLKADGMVGKRTANKLSVYLK